MKEWILSICALGIITSVILLIIPRGRLSYLIKGTLSLLMIVVILKPLVSSKYDELWLDKILNDNKVTVSTQENYINYINQKKIDSAEDDCLKILNSLNIHKATINFDYEIIDNIIKIKSVFVNIANEELNQNLNHTNIIEEIKELLGKYLKIDKGVITIYERK